MLSGIRRAMARVDSWLNTITAVGGTSSKVASFTFEARALLPDETLQALYEQDGYATRIIDCVPDEATRQGLTITTGDKAVDAALAVDLERLGAHERITDAWCWGRLYGGGALFVGADDGVDPREPLDLTRVRAVRFLTVLEKRELTPATWVTDNLHPLFGDVETYRLSRGAGGGGVDTREIHTSRLIRFFGARVTPRRRAHLQGWGISEIQRVYDKLVQFNATYGALGELLQDGSQGVFGIKDLYGMMAQDKEGTLKQRLELLDMSKSVAKSILVDADSESYSRVESTAMTGYPDVIDRFALLLAGAAGIPVTILMGQAPAGLNATGDSDIRWFYDRVRTQQTNNLLPRVRRLAKILLAAKSGPSNGEALDVKVAFPSLWQMSPVEKADLRQKTSATDEAYIRAGVVTPEEVAISRFGEDGWSDETTISLADRKAALLADAEGGADAPGADHADGIAGVIARVAGREIPRDAGVALLGESFGLSPEAAERAMGEAGRSFFTAPEVTHAAEMDAMRAELAKLRASNQGHQAYTARVVKAAKEGGLELGAFTAAPPTVVAEGDDIAPGDVVEVPAEHTDARDSGVAVVLVMPLVIAQRIALPGGEAPEQLHLTLAYLGKDLSAEDIEAVRSAVQAWSQEQAPLSGHLGGIGRFDGDTLDPVWVTPDVPGLSAAREALVAALPVPPASEHGFTPHVTLAYLPKGEPTPGPVQRTPVPFQSVEVWATDERYTYSLLGAE